MNIYGYSPRKLKEYFEYIGENPAKAMIIFDGIYRRGLKGFTEYGFAERIVERLNADFDFALPKVVEKRECEDAAKLLLELSDGEYVETVLMRQMFGNCICVSTQVGCNMGCKFCQSGLLKTRRNLTAAEITGQALTIAREFDCRIDGVSVMGIGEPFDNFEAVADFCEIVTEDKGLAVGRRHVTVSTCGIVPGIYDYADLPRPCNLAISLHAPTDELRTELMPINKAYPIAEVIKAAEYFSGKTHRRVTLEYVMLKGVNDTAENAKQLAGLVRGHDFYVNLIPYNSTDSGYTKSSAETVSEFCAVLKDNGVIATKRREFGADLNAACGQLRADYTGQ
ncbi:MAG: 23S rRNA (adenine(2503)-C(2))-methyltransferase RlmN [Oscillospiraceae bacterium]|nr:23S rRNA (adenine(2503)-C(2))-methyltransferase RlmN [Oscillospiraceae bacterium]